eukprot:COSAG02_NODE_9346_length_2249_cov_16.914395_2_plen_205_part_00
MITSGSARTYQPPIPPRYLDVNSGGRVPIGVTHRHLLRRIDHIHVYLTPASLSYCIQQPPSVLLVQIHTRSSFFACRLCIGDVLHFDVTRGKFQRCIHPQIPLSSLVEYSPRRTPPRCQNNTTENTNSKAFKHHGVLFLPLVRGINVRWTTGSHCILIGSDHGWSCVSPEEALAMDSAREKFMGRLPSVWTSASRQQHQFVFEG